MMCLICVITTQERECTVMVSAGTWQVCDNRSSGYVLLTLL